MASLKQQRSDISVRQRLCVELGRLITRNAKQKASERGSIKHLQNKRSVVLTTTFHEKTNRYLRQEATALNEMSNGRCDLLKRLNLYQRRPARVRI